MENSFPRLQLGVCRFLIMSQSLFNLDITFTISSCLSATICLTSKLINKMASKNWVQEVFVCETVVPYLCMILLLMRSGRVSWCPQIGYLTANRIMV